MSEKRVKPDSERRKWPLSVSMHRHEHRDVRLAAALSDTNVSAFIRAAACAAAARIITESRRPIARQSAA